MRVHPEDPYVAILDSMDEVSIRRVDGVPCLVGDDQIYHSAIYTSPILNFLSQAFDQSRHGYSYLADASGIGRIALGDFIDGRMKRVYQGTLENEAELRTTALDQDLKPYSRHWKKLLTLFAEVARHIMEDNFETRLQRFEKVGGFHTHQNMIVGIYPLGGNKASTRLQSVTGKIITPPQDAFVFLTPHQSHDSPISTGPRAGLMAVKYGSQIP